MSASLRLMWREGVSASAGGDGALVVQGPGVRLCLRQTSDAILDAARRFEPPGEDQDRLRELIGGEGDGALARWHYWLERLTQRGLLRHVAFVGETRLATLVAVSPYFVSRPSQVALGRRYILSRFAYLRREGAETVLESPLAHARIILNHCRVAAVVSALAAPATARELADQVGVLSPDAVAGVLALLLKAGMLDEPGKDEVSSLQTWEFHDMLFHARSRRGRFDAPYGGTCRLADHMPPPPALKPAVAGEAYDLYRPDLDRLERDDPPLARVQAQRRSIREFDTSRPITDRQLGEFLFRVARVTGYCDDEVETPQGPVHMRFALRPYPAGGGLYELELYIAIQVCANVDPGLYYYDPAGHRLIRLRGRTPQVTELLCDAAASAAIPEDTMQVLLILAARFPRLAWKYESIAYALTLKHVGVVYQAMYLAATAMGLAPCAIGGGDADLFARASGTDYYSETSVGEFLLGNPRRSAASFEQGPG
ncbi:MAG TPA: SagB family peptide dehydrogenase [Gemmataceae bacterium]|nr:SagB family peptide dehydrogenase [Gemmataceae bacterium]